MVTKFHTALDTKTLILLIELTKWRVKHYENHIVYIYFSGQPTKKKKCSGRRCWMIVAIIAIILLFISAGGIAGLVRLLQQAVRPIEFVEAVKDCADCPKCHLCLFGFTGNRNVMRDVMRDRKSKER